MIGQMLLLLIQLSSGPASFAEAKALADQQVKSLPLMQSIETDVSLSHAVTLAFKACNSIAPQSNSSDSFDVVLSIGASGKVQGTWLQGSSAFAKCVEQNLSTATFPKPSIAPLFKYYGYSVEP